MINPWKTISRKEVYQNRYLKVYEAQVQFLGQKKLNYAIAQRSDFVLVVPLDRDKNTFLVGEYRYTYRKKSWALPSGYIESGETPLQAAKRELEEEVGMKAKNWVSLGMVQLAASVYKARGHLFLASSLNKTTPKDDPLEVIETKKLSLISAVNMVMAGELDQLATCFSLLKVAKLLEQQ